MVLESDFTAVIEKIVPGGLALARTSEGVVFVPGALPGEKLLLRPVIRKRDYIQGEIREIIEPSPDRIEPPCRYYSSCGGCDFQYASYDTQIDIKRTILQDALQRIGAASYDRVKIFRSEPWGYRRRARFHRDGQGKTGFFMRSSNQVLPVESCPVLHRDLDRLLREHPESIDVTASMFAGDEGIASSRRETSVTLSDSAGRAHRFLFDGRVFFQSNTDALSPLLDMITRDAEGTEAVDLYSGVGTFAAFLADVYPRTSAVEQDRGCLAFAGKNLPRRVRTMPVSVEQWSRNLPEKRIDRLVIDPPRRGISAGALKAVLAAQPKQIVSVSCSPATFARDLRTMTDSGYAVEELIGVDLYPQTFHLECAALLTLTP